MTFEHMVDEVFDVLNAIDFGRAIPIDFGAPKEEGAPRIVYSFDDPEITPQSIGSELRPRMRIEFESIETTLWASDLDKLAQALDRFIITSFIPSALHDENGDIYYRVEIGLA